MAHLVVQTAIKAPLAKVWLFHMDPAKNMPRLQGGWPQVVVEWSDMPLRERARITLAVTSRTGRVTRVRVVLTEFVPPHGVLFGQEARFTDIQEEGPFAAWTHSHEFEAAEDNTTLLRDVVEYRVKGGFFGKLVDVLFVRWRVAAAFRQRGRRMQELLDES